MAFYSSGQVQSLYIDPKSFIDGRRAVFELDGHHLAYLPNMRLLNIGIFGQATATARYNDLVGANAIIEAIHLYDGKTLLSEVRKYGQYRGFLLQNVKNSSAQSISAMKNLNKLGFCQSHNLGGAERGKLAYGLNTVALNPDTTRDGAFGGIIDLREVLPLLNNMSHLPSDMFKNLRLEVIFNTNVARGIMNNNTHTIAGMKFPLLAVDVIDDESVVRKMNAGMSRGVQWLEIEHTQVSFPVGDATNNGQNVKQSINTKIDAYKNKSVERLLQIKELVDATPYIDTNVVQGFGAFSSPALQNERIQYRLNGRNIIPDIGVQGSAEQMSYVVDTFGDGFAFPGSNATDIDSGVVVSDSLGTDGTKYAGQLSYNAVYLGERVRDLQIEHERTQMEDTTAFRPSTAALNVHYFAEVRKAIVPQKSGEYLVSYL